MTAKKRSADDANDALAGFELLPHRSRRGVGQPRVRVISHGRILCVYPDKATTAAMKSEGWTKVSPRIKRDTKGNIEEVALTKASEGIGVRYYTGQLPSIHVRIAGIGRGSGGCDCEVRRAGDSFIFRLIEPVRVEAEQESP